MAKAYSMDLRQRVVAFRDAGASSKEVAQRLGVSSAWVRRLIQRRRETGSIAVRNGKRGPKPKLAAHHQRLRELVRTRPDATLEELRAQLPVKVSMGTIWAAMRLLGLALKKSPSCRRATGS
jgi:transposase